MLGPRFKGGRHIVFQNSLLKFFDLCSILIGILLALVPLGAEADPTLAGDPVQSVYISQGFFYVSWSGGDIGALLESQTAPYAQSGATNKLSYSPPAGSTVYTVTGKAAGVYYYTGVYAVAGVYKATNDVAVILYRNLPVITAWSTAYAGNALPISWTTSAPAGGYILEQQYNGGAWTQIYAGASNSFTTGALAAGTYNFRVRPVTNFYPANFASATVTTTVVAPPTLTGDYEPTSGYQSIYLGGATGSYTVSWTGGDLNALFEAQTAPYLQATATNKISYSPAANVRSFTFTGKPRGVYYYTGFVGLCNNCAVTNDLMVIAYDQLPVVTAPANNSTGTFNISWSIVPLGGLYTLEQQVNGGSWTSLTPTTTTTYSASGLLSGTYNFRVHPCYFFYCAPFTSAVASTVVSAPPPSTTLTVPPTSTTGTYSLSWLSALTATSYQVDQSVNYGAWTTIYSGSALGTNVFGNGNGLYQYRVRACNVNGCSADSPIQNTSVLLPPNPPATLNVPPSSTGTLSASWAAASTATSYQLDQRLNEGAWTTVFSGSATTAALSGLTTGIYDFQARACNASGCGVNGSIATTYVGVIPPVPGAISGPNPNSGAFTLTWAATPGTNTYTLQEKVGSGSWTTLATLGSATANIAGHAAGTYSYQVQACNTAGCSAFGPTFTTVAAATTTPAGLTVPATNDTGTFTISWAGVSLANYYELQQRLAGGSWSTIYNGPLTSNAVTTLAGNFDFQIRACNDTGCSAFSAPASISVTLTGGVVDSATPAALPTVSLADILRSDNIGSTDGTFRVDESGAATYKIPIAAVVGTAGVTPQLTLNYNSQGGNGLLGQGWSLGGLSEITRCRQTLQQDSNTLPITWSYQDRFCLDGQRLVLVPGSVAYGYPGSVYKTEIDSYVRVTALGGSAGHPSYFKIEKKDGSISFYGDAPASRDPTAQPLNDSPDTDGKVYVNSDPVRGIMTWKLRKFQDNAGNAIWYQYGYYFGWYVNEVRYAYGSNTGPDNYNARIYFSYSGRPDVFGAGGLGGYSVPGNGLRIQSITVENAGYTVRSYNLGYKDSEVVSDDAGNSIPVNLSRLISVQECSTVCLPATQFTWASATQVGFGTRTVASLGAAGRNAKIVNLVPLDINGDGCTDFAWMEQEQGNLWQVKLRYAISDCAGGWTAGKFLGTPNSEDYLVDAHSSDRPGIQAADFNADGRADLMYTLDGNTWQVFPSVPQLDGSWRLSVVGLPALTTGDTAVFMDTSGDGLADKATLSNLGGSITINKLIHDSNELPTSSHYYKFNPAVQTLSASPATASAIQLVCCSATSGNPFAGGSVAGDLNGDGVTDLILRTNGTMSFPFFAQVKGNQFDLVQNAIPSTKGQIYGLDGSTTVDLNGDGLPDLVYRDLYAADGTTQTGAGDFTIQINKGGVFDTPKKVPSLLGTQLNGLFSFVDYNHDGFADLLYYDYVNHNVKVVLWDNSAGNFTTLLQPGITWTQSYHNGDGKYDWIGDYRLLDIDGDGQLDYVERETTAMDQIAVRFAKGANQPRHVITGIVNGLGATTAITYENLNKTTHYERLRLNDSTPPCTVNYNGTTYTYACPNTKADIATFYNVLNGPWDLPGFSESLAKDSNAPVLEWMAPVFVVTSVSGSAPATTPAAALGTVNNNALSRIDYYYGEAKIQAGGRGLLGFQWVRTVDMQSGIITTTKFRQDFPFTGCPLTTDVATLGGQKISSSSNYWAFQDWQGGNPGKPYRVVLLQATDLKYDALASGNPLISNTKTGNTYDADGNVVTNTVDIYTDAAGSDANHIFSKVVSNTYGNTSYPEMQRLGRLTETKATSWRPGQSKQMRKSQFSYYCMNGETCDTGLSGMLANAIVIPCSLSGDTESCDTNNALTTRHEYNLTLGVETKSTLSGAGFSSRYSRWEYDSLGRFKNNTYNSLEQPVERVLSRSVLGQPLTVSGLNNAQVVYRYGGFGRRYLEYSNNGNYTISLLSTPNAYAPAGTVYLERTTKSDGSQSFVAFDKVARPVRSGTVAFGDSTIYNVSDSEYDSSGRVIHRSNPFPAGTTLSSVPFTRVTFDILGRVTNTVLPDGTNMGTAYDGLKTTYTDANGHTKKEIRNALGEMDYVLDHNGTKIQYAYNADGTLSSTTTVAGNGGSASIATASGTPPSIATTFAYDVLGRKVSMTDPDKGAWAYEYYVNGELKKQTDAKGQAIEFQYDLLGRMVSRKDTCGTGSANDGCASGVVQSNVTWIYDTATNGIGLLDHVSDSVTGYVKAVSYDTLGRVSQTVISPTSGEAYFQRVVYDSYGRIDRQYDAVSPLSGSRNIYNANGYLSEIHDAASNDPYYVINAMDAAGRVTQETNGAITTYRTFDPAMGRLTALTSSVLGLGATQNLGYSYDLVGNLQRRTDNLSGQTESFAYDELNRLALSTVQGSTAVSMMYDSFGNVVSKGGVAYSYGGGSASCTGGGSGAGVHAAMAFGTSTYTYDCNGNNRTSDGRTLQYSVFDKPINIAKGSVGFSTAFQYDPDRNFYRRTDTNNGQQTTITTVGNVEKVTKPDGSYELRRYVAGTLVSTQYSAGRVKVGGTNEYLLKDYLGSTDTIVDQHGNVVSSTGNSIKQKQSFDSWGLRRDTTTWSPFTSSLLAQFDHSTTNKGFTGHEMLDELGVIHMGGRVYDPRLGRFLQADTLVPYPTDTQSYNRYSYMRNSPLNGVDPTGQADIFTQLAHGVDHFFEYGFPSVINSVFVIEAGIDCGPYCAAVVAAGLIKANGGTWSQALVAGMVSGASVYAFGELGNVNGSWYVDGMTVQGFIEYGTVGGIGSLLQGGNFGYGFIAAGAGGAVGSAMGGATPLARIAVAAAVGGTLSSITGGKFANGAVTAAFATAMGSAHSQNGSVAASGKGEGGDGSGDYEGTEKKIANALNIDGKYRIVSKDQSDIAKVTGGDSAAHGTVRKVDGSYEIWVDSDYSGKDYWTVVYHEMRHVWQYSNLNDQLKGYANSRAGLAAVRALLEYDAWKYTSYVSNSYDVGLDNKWVHSALSSSTNAYNSGSVLGKWAPPLEIRCCE